MTPPSTSRRAILRHAAWLVIPIPAARLTPAAAASRGIVDEYFDAVQRRDVPAILALFSPTAVYEDVTFGFRISGHDALRGMFQTAFAGMSSARFRRRRTVSDAEQVVVEWESTGAHTGPILGVAATGRTLTVRAVSLIETANGTIRSVTDYTDRAGLESQLREARR